MNESLSRCTRCKLRKYLVDEVVARFLRNGFSCGWVFSVVVVGWIDIKIGEEDDFDYVFLCHKLAGLGLISQGWHGCKSFMGQW